VQAPSSTSIQKKLHRVIFEGTAARLNPTGITTQSDGEMGHRKRE